MQARPKLMRVFKAYRFEKLRYVYYQLTIRLSLCSTPNQLKRKGTFITFLKNGFEPLAEACPEKIVRKLVVNESWDC